MDGRTSRGACILAIADARFIMKDRISVKHRLLFRDPPLLIFEKKFQESCCGLLDSRTLTPPMLPGPPKKPSSVKPYFFEQVPRSSRWSYIDHQRRAASARTTRFFASADSRNLAYLTGDSPHGTLSKRHLLRSRMFRCRFLLLRCPSCHLSRPGLRRLSSSWACSSSCLL